jgi:hypothetical protein
MLEYFLLTSLRLRLVFLVNRGRGLESAKWLLFLTILGRLCFPLA